MLDLIILAIIAIVIISKLLSILGRSDDDFAENNKMDPIIEQLYKKNAASREKVDIEIVSAIEAGLPQNIRDVFDSIRKKEPTFNADAFLKGAKAAFNIIIQAFAKNDKETLKNLLAPSVFKDFANAIDARIAKKQVLEKMVVGINEIEITDADLSEDTATIAVKITSDQVTALKDYLGNVLDGNSSTVVTNQDLWIFTRNLRKDKVWFLTNTNST
ncbi:MAG: Tim44/TimA family putative adaptor protein [Candidatus Midichloria sp.]|uniref:Tim44 domain-containing protein n=1 Tax=Hyalomma marginatum TaxID=34627 RepID=A0A8S4C1I0_9ACAR|nr:Tim44 domain-containing protein [Hyalomma marginatum]CAG7594462.1 Tim44 domain-containing protein [Hyalomma marginatum]